MNEPMNEAPMNMTLVTEDRDGLSIKCRLVHSRRHPDDPQTCKEVILTFETSKEAMEVFQFTWCDVLKMEAPWLKRKRVRAR
jgi:hypothetical protein